jgi:hypothetical protein
MPHKITSEDVYAKTKWSLLEVSHINCFCHAVLPFPPVSEFVSFIRSLFGFPPTIPVHRCTLGAMAAVLVTATDAVGSEIWAFCWQIRDPQHYRPFERLALSLAIHTIHIHKFSAR